MLTSQYATTKIGEMFVYHMDWNTGKSWLRIYNNEGWCGPMHQSFETHHDPRHASIDGKLVTEMIEDGTYRKVLKEIEDFNQR